MLLYTSIRIMFLLEHILMENLIKLYTIKGLFEKWPILSIQIQRILKRIHTCEYSLPSSNDLVLFANSNTEVDHRKHCYIHYDTLNQ